MECFSSKAPGRTLLLAFDRGDLLLEGIAAAMREQGIETAVITGGIGSLTHCNLHTITITGLPPKDKYIEVRGPVELGSVQGSVLDGVPHVHIVASNHDTNECYVGHLEPGSRVCYRAEVSIQELNSADVESYVDEATGLVRLRSAKPAGRPT